MELNRSIFKWLIISNLITVVLLFGSNLAWIIYESQFQVIQESQETQTVENVETVHDITQY